MLASISQVVDRLRKGLGQELDDDAVHRACEETGYTWRNRKLNPVTTVRLFFLQILWGNTACNHVPRLAKADVTGSAYCEARARLPLAALQTLLTRCTAAMAESARETGRWLGHRLFLCDGSRK